MIKVGINAIRKKGIFVQMFSSRQDGDYAIPCGQFSCYPGKQTLFCRIRIPILLDRTGSRVAKGQPGSHFKFAEGRQGQRRHMYIIIAF